jgi:hypothetical protein
MVIFTLTPAFEDCFLLLKTFKEEYGTDCIKGRFDKLPIHQSSYSSNVTNRAENDIVNDFHSLQNNDPALQQIDIMGMTPALLVWLQNITVLIFQPYNTVPSSNFYYMQKLGNVNYGGI